MTDEPRPSAVYRFRDAQGRLLYIGSTYNVSRRIHDLFTGHSYCADWWPEVAGDPEVTWYPNRSEALAAEKHAIETEHPRCNRTHNKALPPDDWEWKDWEPPVNWDVIRVMANRDWSKK